MKLTKVLFCVIMTLLCFSAHAQYTAVNALDRGKNPGILGGPDGKTFAAIIETDGNKVTLIENTLKFLKEKEIVEKDFDMGPLLDELSDSLSQFTIPVAVKVGYFLAGPKIARYSERPIRVIMDMRFEFYDTGNAMIVFENFREQTFSHLTDASKSLLKERNYDYPHYDISKDLEVEWDTFQSAPLYTTNLVKGLFIVNNGIERAKEIFAEIDEFFEKLNEQFAVLDEVAEKSKFFRWQTDEEAYDYLIERQKANDLPIGMPAVVPKFKKELEAGRMFSLKESVFRKEMRAVIVRTFAAIQVYFGGKITGVAEDGEQTWALSGGSLLPVDPKLKKTLEKNGQDYFSYEVEE